MRANSLRGHGRTQHEGRRPVVASAATDVARAALEPAAADAQARRAVEDTVGTGSPLGTREVHRERLVREAPGIGQGEAEPHEVGGGYVDLEGTHVTTRGLHVVTHEARASVERLDVHVTRGLLVELGEDLRRALEEALGLRTDVGVVLEGGVDLPEHAEDVLRDDLVEIPALLVLLDALRGLGELGEDDETTVRVLRQDELAPVLRCIAVAAFGCLACGRDVHVVAVHELLDATEVDAGEDRLENVPTLEG